MSGHPIVIKAICASSWWLSPVPATSLDVSAILIAWLVRGYGWLLIFSVPAMGKTRLSRRAAGFHGPAGSSWWQLQVRAGQPGAKDCSG